MDTETNSETPGLSYYQRHREKLLTYQKNWKKQNREKVLAEKKRYRTRHKERDNPRKAQNTHAWRQRLLQSLTEESKLALRELNRERSRQYYHKNRERINQDSWKKQRGHHLKRKYGITEAEYLVLMKKQKGMCAICSVTKTLMAGKERLLAVDHCHITGKVRGLLCGRCNLALSFLNEDPTIFARARRYLLKHASKD